MPVNTHTKQEAGAVSNSSSTDLLESVAEKTWDKHYKSATWRKLEPAYRKEMMAYAEGGFLTAKRGSFRTPNPHGRGHMGALLWDAGYISYSNV